MLTFSEDSCEILGGQQYMKYSGKLELTLKHTLGLAESIGE